MRFLTLFVLVLTLALFVRSASAEEAAAPTKEQGVAVLKKLLAALESKDWDAAMGLMCLPPDLTPEQKEKWKESLTKLLERKEISAAGIEKLAAEGKWGTLVEVFGQERADAIVHKVKVPVEKCYGLRLDDAEAGFAVVDGALKIVRCDDIGKLN